MTDPTIPTEAIDAAREAVRALARTAAERLDDDPSTDVMAAAALAAALPHLRQQWEAERGDFLRKTGAELARMDADLAAAQQRLDKVRARVQLANDTGGSLASLVHDLLAVLDGPVTTKDGAE